MKGDEISKIARSHLTESKYGATWLLYLDMRNLLSFSGISKKYFDRSSQWFMQRMHGYKVHDKKVIFTPEEYSKLSASLRDMASDLNRLADAIDNADYLDINQ